MNMRIDRKGAKADKKILVLKDKIAKFQKEKEAYGWRSDSRASEITFLLERHIKQLKREVRILQGRTNGRDST